MVAERQANKGNWAKEWQSYKKEFETRTGKKKPSASLTTKIGKSGLSPTLKKVDKAFIGFTTTTSAKKKAKFFSEYMTQCAKFKTLADSYFVDVQRAMIDAGKDKDLMKELDVIRKKVRSLSATLESQGRAMDAAVKNLSVMEKMARDLSKDLDGCMKRGLTFVAQVRSNPIAKVWNDNIKAATRPINQNIGNVDKILRKGHVVEGVPQATPTALFRALEPYAADGVRFTEEDDGETILAESKRVLQIIQAVDKWRKTAA